MMQLGQSRMMAMASVRSEFLRQGTFVAKRRRRGIVLRVNLGEAVEEVNEAQTSNDPAVRGYRE